MAGFFGLELPRMPGETAADYNRRHKAFLQQQDYELERAKLAASTKVASQEILYSPENVASRAASTAAWAAPTASAVGSIAGAVSSIYGGSMSASSTPNVTANDYVAAIGAGLTAGAQQLAPVPAPAPPDVGIIPGTTQTQSLGILAIGAVILYLAVKK
jgi:hypothetical protein